MNNPIDIQKLFPITKVSDNKILSGIGDITWGYQIQWPEVFTLSESDYESIYSQVLDTFSVLPEGCVITQIDDLDTVHYNTQTHFKSYTLKQNHKKLLGREILEHKSTIYISYPHKKINALNNNQNSAVRLFNYLNNPHKGFPKTYEKAERLQKQVTQTLTGLDNVSVTLLCTKELTNEIYKHWSISENEYKIGKTIPPINKDEGQLRVGDKYLGVVSVVNHGEVVQLCKKHKGGQQNEYSDVKSETGIHLPLGTMYQAIFGLPFKHRVTRTMVIRNKQQTNIKLFFTQARESSLSFFLEDARQRVENITLFKHAVTNRNYTMVDMSCNIILPCNNIKELEDKCNITKSTLRNVNDAQTYIEPFSEALPLWVGSTPGYTRGNYRSFLTVMEHGLTYFNYESTSRGAYRGHLFVDRLGTPMNIDLWNNEFLSNRNGIVEGGSGTGKSFTLNNFIDQDLEQGYHVMILDVGHSYKDLCTFRNGRYYDSSKLEDISYPFFICRKDDDGHYQPDDDKLLFIQSVLLAIYKGGAAYNNEEYAIIMDIVDKFYLHINATGIFPLMTAFYNFFKKEYKMNIERENIFKREAFLSVLEPFVYGKYKHLLNSEEKTELTKERFIVFDIEAISEDQFAFPVVGLIIMEMVMDKVRKLRGVPKRFIIDEGWKVLKGSLNEFVEYLFRTFRKNEGSVFLATQAITDLEQNIGEEMARALVSNADIMILMRRATSKNYPALQKWLSLTDFEIDMLKDAKKRDNDQYREFFLKIGEFAKLVRLESHEKTIALYSSKGNEKTRINKHYKESDNLEYAINQFTTDNVKLKYLIELHRDGAISNDKYSSELKKIEQL